MDLDIYTQIQLENFFLVYYISFFFRRNIQRNLFINFFIPFELHKTALPDLGVFFFFYFFCFFYRGGAAFAFPIYTMKCKSLEKQLKPKGDLMTFNNSYFVFSSI